jgi:hypothetical protein
MVSNYTFPEKSGATGLLFGGKIKKGRPLLAALELFTNPLRMI